jgi:hypothetical protein
MSNLLCGSVRVPDWYVALHLNFQNNMVRMRIELLLELSEQVSLHWTTDRLLYSLRTGVPCDSVFVL